MLYHENAHSLPAHSVKLLLAKKNTTTGPSTILVTFVSAQLFIIETNNLSGGVSTWTPWKHFEQYDESEPIEENLENDFWQRFQARQND
jgi:hypothetical protein